VLAQVLTPKHQLDRFGRKVLGDIIPGQFAGWMMRLDADAFVPEQSDALAHLLYDQSITRVYRDHAGHDVMLLIAHGSRQTDALQLHRPEACYRAFGYTVSNMERTTLALSATRRLNLNHFSAVLRAQNSRISYWTRIGDDCPDDERAQNGREMIEVEPPRR